MASSSRRRRAVDSDDSDGDSSGPDATSAKRQRTNNAEDATINASVSPAPHTATEDISKNVTRTEGGGHQPGAIVKIKVTDFVTYESAEFGLGPHLNMIIGPNGTGKSSLVCAIALGLGYPPKILGRAMNVGEFVKHGCDCATVEIELKCRPNEVANHHVKVRIFKEGDKRKWWINGSSTTLTAVQNLRASFGIQCDNLCQFLPQDRVAEFAGLSPVDLLHHTQRAAAPPEMLKWHDDLIRLRDEEKHIQSSHEAEREQIAKEEARQEALRPDVERLRERDAIQTRIDKLEKTRPFVEYSKARDDYQVHKERKRRAKARMQRLEEQVDPTLKIIKKKEVYQEKVKEVVNARQKQVSVCERTCDLALDDFKAVDQNIKEVTLKREGEINGDKKRKQEVQTTLANIREIEGKMKQPPPEFDGPSWNVKIREKEAAITTIREEDIANRAEIERRNTRGREINRENQEIAYAMENLETQAGKQAQMLKAYSAELAKAWSVVEANKHRFTATVYGPPVVTCTVKDMRYADHIEALVNRSDMSALTVTNAQDSKVLNDLLLKEHGLSIASRTAPLQFDNNTKGRQSKEDLNYMGLDGWAIDFVEGPEPVLAMLSNASNLGRIPITLQEVSSAQYQLIEQGGIDVMVIGRTSYRTTRRKEYGASGISTATTIIKPARHWINQPVTDTGEKQTLLEQRDALATEFGTLKQAQTVAKARGQDLQQQVTELKREQQELQNQKNELQRAASYYNGLPGKLDAAKETLLQKRQRGLQVGQRLTAIDQELDNLFVVKLEKALKHKQTVEDLRSAHDQYLEAQILFLEAESEYETLTQRHIAVKERLDAEKARVTSIEKEAEDAKKTATAALKACESILAEEDAEGQEYFKNLPLDINLESVEQDLVTERAKLEFAHGANAGAIDEWNAREVKLEKLREKVRENDAKLEKMARRIAKIRERWEPALDKLIEQISDAFSDNFQRISCAGEVKVHKDEDFDQWSIQVWVKFRESESLQLLDQHRQSGGERSVSTIFYLMSLQSLALAPFRVVDEINQGMDPRNERMVHGRMVDIACQEYTSQYFLITPKLLTNLAYSPMMKTLIINSGEFMPKDQTRFDVEKVLEARRALMAC